MHVADVTRIAAHEWESIQWCQFPEADIPIRAQREPDLAYPTLGYELLGPLRTFVPRLTES